MRPTIRIQLGEHVVEEEERRATVKRSHDVQLGQLEGEDGRPLLAAGGEGRQVPAIELEDEVVAVRADKGRAVPDLLVRRLRQPPRQCVPGRLPRELRRVRRVAQRQAPHGRLVRGDLRMGGRQWSSQDVEQSPALGHDRPAGVEEHAVPEADLVARCAIFPDRPQQAVALLQGPPIRREGIGIGR